MSAPALPGEPWPLGATPGDGGTNFAVASRADAVELCLFDAAGAETWVPLPEYDAGVWHGFVPGVGPGQAYGYRAAGPWDPTRGLRWNPAKLLLDPYAAAVDGEVRFGPEVLGHDPAHPDRPSALDSAGHVPRSLVVDPAPERARPARPRRNYADTVLYEVHVKGFTARHPQVPEALRGTYAGLAHDAALAHQVGLGITAVELLPVHQHVPEAFLPARGQANYWGYNTIAVYRDGADDPDRAADGTPLVDDDFLALVNGWWEPLEFAVPATRPGQGWRAEIDTAALGRETAADGGKYTAGDPVPVGPRSIVVLRGPVAGPGAGT